MTRPLARAGIDELEALHVKGKINQATLKSLIFELKHRKPYHQRLYQLKIPLYL